MSAEDRRRWDARYEGGPKNGTEPKSSLIEAAGVVPTSGVALDLACGEGQAAVWLAQRGLDVRAVDVSPVAIASLHGLAERAGVAERITAEVVDLDEGLPGDEQFDVIVCLHFRTPLVAELIRERLRPSGVVVTSVLSTVGRRDAAGEGPDPRFLAAPGELLDLADGLEVINHDEAEGQAVLVARKLA